MFFYCSILLHFHSFIIFKENLSVHPNDSQQRKQQLQNDLIRIRKEHDAQVTLRQERLKQKQKLEEQLNEMVGMAPVSETQSKKVFNLSVVI